MLKLERSIMVINAGNYKVRLSKEWHRDLKHFLAARKWSSVFILCDSNTLLHCLPLLVNACPALGEAEIIETEPGEAGKSLAIAEQIWLTLSEHQADRDTLLVNLGGGVISDLGGFCASVYKRGISFINLPTSLLAMADASVGAKNGIDFNGFKNMIGTFSEPSAVFVNTDFLHTLPQRHLKNGLTEIYKMALVSNASFWQQLAENKKPDLSRVISKSILLKNNIVKKDPFDKGIRKILNFGHTAGHALESASMGSVDELLHGEAVLAGMLIESHLSWQKKLLSKKELNEIIRVLQNRFTLPDPLHFNAETLIPYMQNDKKNSKGRMRFSLLNGIGSCLTDAAVTETQVQKAIAFYKEQVYDHN